MMTDLAPIMYVIKKGLIHTLNMNKENMLLMLTHFTSFKTFIKILISVLMVVEFYIMAGEIQMNLLKNLEYFY